MARTRKQEGQEQGTEGKRPDELAELREAKPWWERRPQTYKTKPIVYGELSPDEVYAICRKAAAQAVDSRWHGPYPHGWHFLDMIQEVTARILSRVAKFRPKVRKNGKLMTAPEYAYVAASFSVYDIGREVKDRITKTGELYDAHHKGLVEMSSADNRGPSGVGALELDYRAIYVDFKGNKHGLAV